MMGYGDGRPSLLKLGRSTLGIDPLGWMMNNHIGELRCYMGMTPNPLLDLGASPPIDTQTLGFKSFEMTNKVGTETRIGNQKIALRPMMVDRVANIPNMVFPDCAAAYLDLYDEALDARRRLFFGKSDARAIDDEIATLVAFIVRPRGPNAQYIGFNAKQCLGQFSEASGIKWLAPFDCSGLPKNGSGLPIFILPPITGAEILAVTAQGRDRDKKMTSKKNGPIFERNDHGGGGIPCGATIAYAGEITSIKRL